MFVLFIGQYDVKKSTLLNVACSNEYEVLGFAIIEPDLLIVASGSPDVKVRSQALTSALKFSSLWTRDGVII